MLRVGFRGVALTTFIGALWLALGCSPVPAGVNGENANSSSAPSAASEAAPSAEFLRVQARLQELEDRLASQEATLRNAQLDQSAFAANARAASGVLDLALVPIGTIVAWAGEGEPPASSGWVVCDGRELDPKVYESFAKVMASASWGNSVTEGKIQVPDLRGMFLRGSDGVENYGEAGRKVGSLQDSATALPRTPFVTSEVGEHSHGMKASGEHTHEMSENGEHSHTYHTNDVKNNEGAGGTFWHSLRAAMKGTTDLAGKHKHTVLSAGAHTHEIDVAGRHFHVVESGGDAETRPSNRAVKWIIRVK